MEDCGFKKRVSDELFHNIVGIYRTPLEIRNNFSNLLQNDILAKLRHSSLDFICGDMNIDLLNLTTGNNDYIEIFRSYSYISLVNKPRREDAYSSKCIDHIWVNQLFEIYSGIINLNITDHCNIFFL